jgi:uncharacterized protein (DUF2336 family)
MTAQPSTNSPGSEAPMILTPGDVERLLTDESSDSRASVLTKISHHYNEKAFQGRANEIAEQIFRLLMKDVAVRVRETLSDQLKNNPDAPRDVMLHLANDTETVALPVLAQSEVLSDADLVRIVEMSHGMGKLLAISQRENVSARVSDALVETNYPQVVTSLLSNNGASISDRSFERIVDEFKNDQTVGDALLQRPQLPRSVVEKFIAQASETVAKQLKEKYNIADTDLQKTTTGNRDDVMQQLLEAELSLHDIEILVAKLASDDRLNASLVMTALCRGQLTFFTVALARFSNIPVQNAMRLVADRGEHGFQGLYQKSGLPDTMLDAIRLLLRSVQDLEGGTAIAGSAQYANRLVERVLSLAGQQQIEYLPYFIALIRQNVNK